VAHGARPEQALADLRDRLWAGGVTVLDVTNPDHRNKATSATLEVSLNRLSPTERDRYTELAIFGEDVDIPLSVLARYWQHTGDWTGAQQRRHDAARAGLGSPGQQPAHPRGPARPQPRRRGERKPPMP
jgi:hypothetical protein